MLQLVFALFHFKTDETNAFVVLKCMFSLQALIYFPLSSIEVVLSVIWLRILYVPFFLSSLHLY